MRCLARRVLPCLALACLVSCLSCFVFTLALCSSWRCRELLHLSCRHADWRSSEWHHGKTIFYGLHLFFQIVYPHRFDTKRCESCRKLARQPNACDIAGTQLLRTHFKLGRTVNDVRPVRNAVASHALNGPRTSPETSAVHLGTWCVTPSDLEHSRRACQRFLGQFAITSGTFWGAS